ncbi:hypothetical protein OnM2_108002 [Erysiphe neolycopersici]|uniref:Uncharacterized protein n=1 Tax=Erysiphe neolycopersici TaxID=212602 RepID=A0A420H6R3_9PEZI|nr:hypothetical protein OnM2_108002 [Erysiphe neolycopersici]
MVILSPRIQFYEIADQEWFPKYLREKFQSCLATCWNFRFPLLQKSSPAQLVAHTLCQVLDDAGRYRFVDFCAGAGGPTPTIEQELNSKLAVQYSSSEKTKGIKAPAQFVLTDLHPHIPEWTRISKHAENITFIPESVNATCAPSSVKSSDEQKVFRLFNLSFHHFDDKLGSDIIRNSLETADGFGIFELQDRTPSSLMLMMLIGLLLFLVTPFYFWRSPGHLFFTYVIPILPFVVVTDGYISCFRTRTPEEVSVLIKNCGASIEDWRFLSGREQHTWPIGHMSWIIAIKK